MSNLFTEGWKALRCDGCKLQKPLYAYRIVDNEDYVLTISIDTSQGYFCKTCLEMKKK